MSHIRHLEVQINSLMDEATELRSLNDHCKQKHDTQSLKQLPLKRLLSDTNPIRSDQAKLPKVQNRAQDDGSIADTRSREKQQIYQITKKNINSLVSSDKIMHKLLEGKTLPKFRRLRSRREFTDGFQLSNCYQMSNGDLKNHLMMNGLDVGNVITTKIPGNKWI